MNARLAQDTQRGPQGEAATERLGIQEQGHEDFEICKMAQYSLSKIFRLDKDLSNFSLCSSHHSADHTGSIPQSGCVSRFFLLRVCDMRKYLLRTYRMLMYSVHVHWQSQTHVRCTYIHAGSYIPSGQGYCIPKTKPR